MKTCSKCSKSYPQTLEYFHKDSTKSCGLRPSCKKCTKKVQSCYKKRTRDVRLKKMSEYYQYVKENGLKRDNITEEMVEESKKFKEANRKRLNRNQDRKRREEVSNGTLKGKIIQIKGCTKNAWTHYYTDKSKSYKYLQCYQDKFISHLIETFELNYKIKWKNCFRKFLHIDHIVPLSMAKTYEELKELAKYENTQFLFSKDNCIKSSKNSNIFFDVDELIKTFKKEGVTFERFNTDSI